jgi:hypothetical protein
VLFYYLDGIHHPVEAVPGDLHFSETSGRDFFDLDELLFVAGDVDVRDPESLGG